MPQAGQNIALHASHTAKDSVFLLLVSQFIHLHFPQSSSKIKYRMFWILEQAFVYSSSSIAPRIDQSTLTVCSALKIDKLVETGFCYFVCLFLLFGLGVFVVVVVFMFICFCCRCGGGVGFGGWGVVGGCHS